MHLSSLRYKYICCGLVVLSISWAIVIFIYVAYLERETKAVIDQKRQQIRIWSNPEDKILGKKSKSKEINQEIKHNNRMKHQKDDDRMFVFEKTVRENGLYNEKDGHLDNLVQPEDEIRAQMGPPDLDEKAIGDSVYKKHKFNNKSLIANDNDRHLVENKEDEIQYMRNNVENLNGNSVDREADFHLQVALPQKVLDLDQLALINNEEDEKKKSFGYNRYAFNGLISDRIGDRRDVPDVRHKLCRAQVYPSNLQKTSIIICYFNESPSALIRMINSILDRTPKALIQEILIIDDFSDLGEAQVQIKEYYEKNWPKRLVELIRTESRLGLIRAKVFGSRRAKGEVLVFLDSHCEVNRQWLEPLLARLKDNPRRFVCPIIDIIDSDTFKYVESPVCMGGFNWGLNFQWDYPASSYLRIEENNIKPLRSPTMAGGLFAVTKQYFQEIGEYDPGMDVWGAENVEISIRIWTCGGELEVIPCSRVAHIFRKMRPYGAPNNEDTFSKNAVRTARVWLDEYLEMFYKQMSFTRTLDVGDLTDRIQLRKRLKCKPFEWYLQNIYPRLLPPSLVAASNNSSSKIASNDIQMTEIKKPTIIGRYLIKLDDSDQCLGLAGQKMAKKGAQIGVDKCNVNNKFQVWQKSDILELKLTSNLCLDSRKQIRLMKCDMEAVFQEWKQTENKQLYNAASGRCLIGRKSEDNDDLFIEMGLCKKEGQLSHWNFFQVVT